MADLIIQPKNDDHLKLNNDAGTTIVELANDESKLRLAQNNISASDGTTAITTSGANVTLAGTANNIGTATGTFNGSLSGATFPTTVTDRTIFYRTAPTNRDFTNHGEWGHSGGENVKTYATGVAPQGFTDIVNMYYWVISTNGGTQSYTTAMMWLIAAGDEVYNQHSLSSTTIGSSVSVVQNTLKQYSITAIGSSGSRFEDLVAAGDAFSFSFLHTPNVSVASHGVSITWRF